MLPSHSTPESKLMGTSSWSSSSTRSVSVLQSSFCPRSFSQCCCCWPAGGSAGRTPGAPSFPPSALSRLAHAHARRLLLFPLPLLPSSLLLPLFHPFHVLARIDVTRATRDAASVDSRAAVLSLVRALWRSLARRSPLRLQRTRTLASGSPPPVRSLTCVLHHRACRRELITISCSAR